MSDFWKSLVPYEVLPAAPTENGNGRPPNAEGSALRRFREQVQHYPPPADGDPRKRTLLYGGAGSVLALIAAGMAGALPSGDPIRHSGFYVLGRSFLAGTLDAIGTLAGPLAIVGALLLVTTLAVALVGREGQAVDVLCLVQPVIGVAALGGSALGWGTLVGLLLLNLAVWIALIVLVAMLVIGVLIGIATFAGE